MTIDCTTGPVEVRIAKQPTNGALRITQADESPGFSRDHPFAPCNDKMVRQKIVSYRPSAGFVGTDKVVVEASFPDDRTERTTYEIEVLRAAGP